VLGPCIWKGLYMSDRGFGLEPPQTGFKRASIYCFPLNERRTEESGGRASSIKAGEALRLLNPTDPVRRIGLNLVRPDQSVRPARLMTSFRSTPGKSVLSNASMYGTALHLRNRLQSQVINPSRWSSYKELRDCMSFMSASNEVFRFDVFVPRI
jgi:hypothetical protein